MWPILFYAFSDRTVIAAGNIIIDAHLKYGAWSKETGIIEADITEVKTLIKAVSDVEKVQAELNID